MKKKITTAGIGIIFFIGMALVLYPMAADMWNDYRQKKLISNYEAAVEELEEKEYKEQWEKAQTFNKQMDTCSPYEDAFGICDGEMEQTEYWKILNVSGDGIMGYLSIPKINVRLSIYHGTKDEVLQTGIGHLNGTSLPVGGEGTHCTLVAHRGLPGARLFTDLDQIEEGDRFYIHILDQTLAYEVCEILPMVDKTDREAITKALAIREGEDLVTLYTCTPYGVNSHRLLVTGRRIPHEENGKTENDSEKEASFFTKKYAGVYLIAGVLVLTGVAYGIRKILINKKMQKEKEQDGKGGRK